jgi:cell division GTPase FtsZ
MIDPAMTSPGLSTDEPKSRAFLSVQEAFIPNIKVFGAGGAGGNVVTKMVDVGIRQVEMVICNKRCRRDRKRD